jgi:hypothetical protein
VRTWPTAPVKLEDRDVAQLGIGLWNRMLIDATRSWKNKRRPEWGNERFPPTVRPAPEDEARVEARWSEYGCPICDHAAVRANLRKANVVEFGLLDDVPRLQRRPLNASKRSLIRR